MGLTRGQACAASIIYTAWLNDMEPERPVAA